jgi:hypothetical protein
MDTNIRLSKIGFKFLRAEVHCGETFANHVAHWGKGEIMAVRCRLGYYNSEGELRSKVYLLLLHLLHLRNNNEECHCG